MFNNLIKIALRIIRKDLFYSIFNIVGLTIGIASSLFLLLYILDELNYDRYHEQSENIYRVVSHISEPDDAFDWLVAQVPFAPKVKEDYPEVEEYVRFIEMGNTLFIKDDIRFYEENVYYVDSSVFNVFTYDLVAGDPEVILNMPNSMVVTRSFAHRYFGDTNPVGKSIQTEDEETYSITGLMEDVPLNSHFRFSALVSRNTLPEQFGGGWGNFGVFTYLLLNEKTDYKQFEGKLKEMYDKYMADIFEQFNIKVVYGLDPISKIHLYSKYEGEPEPTGSIQYIYVFIVVILFMLIIASINYMNLATARSTKRAREVGLRKVAGSGRSLLIVQFLTESLILTIISLMFSILLIFLLLPQFNFISGKILEASVLGHPMIIMAIVGIVIFLGIIGGSYPAFYLSKFNPVRVLKGTISSFDKKISFRKVLVVIQFSISLIMIISTLVVYDQIGFLTKKDIGFEKSNVVRLTLSTGPMRRQFEVLKDALLSSPAIINVGGTSSRVGEGSGKLIMNLETPEGMDERGVNIGVCDEDFIETMGITILEGRDFSSDIMADTATGVLINESLAKRMNWDEPIGKKVQLGSGNEDNNNPVARVVGLMKDYNQAGLYSEVESYLLLFRRNNRVVYIRI
ncbi:MAG: ABC transporter permease, partial [Bacteroidota bacterium]|nr:ABC transporter permease [Bacteroidota bacterium]